MAASSPPAAGSTRGVVAELRLPTRPQLTAISLSSDQRHAVVGGHGIMKVIKLAPEGLSEVATLKAERRTITGSAGSKLSMYDVAWCPSGGNVAASLSNGGVAIWDLDYLSSSSSSFSERGYGGLQHQASGGGARGGGEETGRIIGRHDRSVNGLSWNPFDHVMLISGSQDGILKIWDARSNKAIANFHSHYGAVRDVRFSPLHEFHFAAVFDNGKIQIWDYKFLQPKIKFTSHNKSALSVDWHETVPWRLATSSADKSVKIWDLERPAEKQMAPKTAMEQTLTPTLELASPGLAILAKWRPGRHHENQIATAQAPLVGEQDYAIMVQDVTEPAVAHFAVYGGDDKKNGFCWLDTPLNLENGNPGGGGGTPSSGFGRWVGGGGSREEDAAATEWRGMGTWQHLLTCSDQGVIRVHSLAKSTLPRRNLEVLGTRGFRPSSRGELCSWLHKRDNNPAIWRIYQNEQTQAAPGMFQEEMEQRQASEDEERKRSSSATMASSLSATPHQQLPQQQQQQHHHHHHHQQQQQQQQQQHSAGSTLLQQRLARSLSVGDQTGGIMGRRVAGGTTAATPGGGAAAAASALGLRSASGLPRSPGPPRGQSMSGAAGSIPNLTLGAVAASPLEELPPRRPGRFRSTMTVYPVADAPVAVDVVNWRRTRKIEQRCYLGGPHPRSEIQRVYGPELTEHLTKNVLLRGYHVRILTAHNAEVYLRAGLESMAHTWRMLGIMLSGVPGGLLLPLGAREPDINVAGIDAGVAAAMAAEAAAKGKGPADGGGRGRGGWGRQEAAGGDAAAADRDFSVPEVLDLINKHEDAEEDEEEADEEDERDEPGFQHRVAPEQRQPELNRRAPQPPPPTTTTTATSRQAGRARSSLRLPPKRPSSAAAAAVTTTPSNSAISTSRHGVSSGGGTATGLSSGSMWNPQPLRGHLPPPQLPGLTTRPPPPTPGTATTTTTTDNDGDSDGGTTTTTTFAAADAAWWDQPESRMHRGGGGGGGWGSSAAAAAARNGSGDNGGSGWKQGRPERLERLPDEITLDWLWKSEIEDWLVIMSEAGFAYDTLAVLEVVRSWYYSTGPGRDEEMEEGKNDLEEMRDVKDAPGFWLGTNVTNLQVRAWYMQGLQKLWELQLYSAATDVIKHCGDPYIAQMHRQSTTLHPFCSGCGSSRDTGVSTWCSKCAKQASCCPLCELPVVGLYVECPGCHHGGHPAHMMRWFSDSLECPVETCSHECRPRMLGDFTPAQTRLDSLTA